jgi:hypothetical protein
VHERKIVARAVCPEYLKRLSTVKVGHYAKMADARANFSSVLSVMLQKCKQIRHITIRNSVAGFVAVQDFSEKQDGIALFGEAASVQNEGFCWH